MKKIAGSLSAALAASACAVGAHASLAFHSLEGIEGLGVFQGSVTWVNGGSGTGTLTFVLGNISPIGNGGYITGFAFNVVDGLDLELISAPVFDEDPQWEGMSQVHASPYPDFDFGAALNGNWLGGGAPQHGIAVDTKEQFVFLVEGEAALLAQLTEETIFQGGADPDFAARFRGFADNGSDKVPAYLPAPGALGLAAVAGCLARRRRRSS